MQIPRNYAEAICLDQKNKNTLWQDAIKLEMELMGSYSVFKDLRKNAPVLEGFKNIRIHLIFDCKHDGQHRGRLVADGHLLTYQLIVFILVLSH